MMATWTTVLRQRLPEIRPLAGLLALAFVLARPGPASGRPDQDPPTPCPPARAYLPSLAMPDGQPHTPSQVSVPPILSGPCPRASATPSPTSTFEPSPTSHLTATRAPTASATPTASPSPTATYASSILGIQAFEADYDALTRGFFDQGAAGWVRTRALWAAIEPRDANPRAREWGMSDSMIGAVAGRNLRQVVVVYDAPAWAATRRCGPVDKVPVARYEAFIRDLVERYDGDGVDDAPGRPVVRYWEIGNEPDLAESKRGGEDYGSCFGDEPARYAELLRAAYRAARQADPAAQIVFGPVAYDRFHNAPGIFSPAGPFNYHFVQEVLSASKEAHGDEEQWPFFDLMAFHNYNDFRNNWDGLDGTRPEIIGKADHLRANQMVKEGVYDLRDLPFFVSEVGIASAPTDAWTVRSEAYQAAYVGQVMGRAAAAGLQGAIWYTFSDLPPRIDQPDCQDPYFWLGHGLMRTKLMADLARRCPTNPIPGYAAVEAFVAKPAYAAFRAGAQELAGAGFDRTLTAAETGDPAIEAYRFNRPVGGPLILAFTDHGERLGKKDTPDLKATLTLDAALLPGWTGRVNVTNHLGISRPLSGSTIQVPLTHEPVYVEVAP